jgi:hypothetical protein
MATYNPTSTPSFSASNAMVRSNHISKMCPWTTSQPWDAFVEAVVRMVSLERQIPVNVAFHGGLHQSSHCEAASISPHAQGYYGVQCGYRKVHASWTDTPHSPLSFSYCLYFSLSAVTMGATVIKPVAPQRRRRCHVRSLDIRVQHAFTVWHDPCYVLKADARLRGKPCYPSPRK